MSRVTSFRSARHSCRLAHVTSDRAARGSLASADVTQAYLSMLEKGRRALSEPFVRKALKVLNMPPTVLPLRSEDRGMTVVGEQIQTGLPSSERASIPSPLSYTRIITGIAVTTIPRLNVAS